MMERFGDRRYGSLTGSDRSSSISGTIRGNANNNAEKSLEISVPPTSRSASLALAKLSNHNNLSKSVINCVNNSSSTVGSTDNKNRIISPNSHNEQPPPPLPPIPSSIFKHKHLQYVPQDKHHHHHQQQQPPLKGPGIAPTTTTTTGPPGPRPITSTATTAESTLKTMANGRITNSVHHSSTNGSSHHHRTPTHNSMNVIPSMKSVGVGTNLNYTRTSAPQPQPMANGPLPPQLIPPPLPSNHHGPTNPDYRNYHPNNSLHHQSHPRYHPEGQIQPMPQQTQQHPQPLHSPSNHIFNNNSNSTPEIPRNKSDGPILPPSPVQQAHRSSNSINSSHSTPPEHNNSRNPEHHHHTSNSKHTNNRFPSHISQAQSEIILNSNLKSSANKIVSQNLNGTLSVTGIPTNDSELQLFRVLQRANLLNYFDVMIELGGDDVNQLCDAGEEEFLEIMALIGMASKPLHVRRLQKSLQDWVTQPNLFPNAILGPPLSAFTNGSGQPFPTLQNGHGSNSSGSSNNVPQIVPIRPIPYHSGHTNGNLSAPVPHGSHDTHSVQSKYNSARNAADLVQQHSSSGSEKSNSPNPPVLHIPLHHPQQLRPNSASPSSISSNPAHSPPTHSQQLNLSIGSNRTQPSSFHPVVPSSSPSIAKSSSGYYSHQTLPNGLSLRIPADSLSVEDRYRGHNDSNSSDSHSSSIGMHETRTVTSPIPFLQDYEIKKINDSAMRIIEKLPEVYCAPKISGRRKSSADFQSVASLSEDDPKRYDEIRKCAAIYGRYDSKRKVQKPLTIHELSLNEAAYVLCKNIPALLTRREELLTLSRHTIRDAGLPFSSLMTVPSNSYSLISRSNNREKNSENNNSNSTNGSNEGTRDDQQVSNNNNVRGSEPQDYHRPSSVPNGTHVEPLEGRPGSGPPNLNENSRSNSPFDATSHSRKRSSSVVDRDSALLSPPPHPNKKYLSSNNGNGKQQDIVDSEPSDLSVINNNNNNNNNNSKSNSS